MLGPFWSLYVPGTAALLTGKASVGKTSLAEWAEVRFLKSL